MRRSVYLWGILTVLTSLVPFFLFQCEFSSRALSYPLYDSGGDNYFGWAMTKAVLDGNFIPFVKMDFPRMAAPFGPLSLSEGFPIPEQLQFLVIRFFGLFSRDPIRVQNLFYLSGYVLSSVAFFASAIWVGIRPSLSFGLSFAFTYLNFHLIRYHHVALSHYWVLAPAAAIVVEVFAKRPVFGRGAGAKLFAVSLGITLWHSYYGYFFAVLYASAWAIEHARSAPRVWVRALAPVFLGFVLALGLSTANYFVARGESRDPPSKFVRRLGDTRYYRLRPTSVLYPTANHRVPTFAKLRDEYWRSGYVEGMDEAIGFTALAGLTLGLWALFRRRMKKDDDGLSPFGSLALLILFFASSFGIAIWISALVTPVFRSTNRVSPMLAATCLFAVGAAIERKLGAVSDRGKARRWAIGVAFALAAFAIWDQVPRFRPSPAYAVEIDAVREFVGKIEAMVGDGAVLQVPGQKFPEGGAVVGMLDYSHLSGPLFSNRTRWSYGAFAGTRRFTEISRATDHPLDLRLARTLGYVGIWIDRAGYVDHGAAIESALTKALKRAPLVSADGRRSFFPYGP